MAIRLLVVDDDPLLLAGMVRVLGQFELSTAASTETALEMLARQPFDAILTDLRVPTTNGIVLLQEVAATYPRIQRYLMSGIEYERMAEHLASKLAHRVFQKPLDVFGLRDALGAIGSQT
jgi:DNA-binding NtrC family response regulator